MLLLHERSNRVEKQKTESLRFAFCRNFNFSNELAIGNDFSFFWKKRCN